MSEIKPVYQTKSSNGWVDIAKEDLTLASMFGATRILYPAAALEALQKELGYSKMAADAEAKFADEYKAKFEALQAENAAQAKRIAKLEAAKPKMAPVQGYVQGIPWDMHLEAYNAYCKRYGAQQALIEGGCRGGFGVSELDMFIPGWREKLSLVGKLNTEIEALRKQVEILQRPLDDEIISRIIVLVKNVSDEELASNVFESVRNMTNWNKSTPAEFLVLLDKTSAQKGTEWAAT